MTVMEAMSRGLLPANATNDPFNRFTTLLTELSRGQQAHTAAYRGSVDQGTIDQGDLGGITFKGGIFNQGGLG